MKISLKIFIYVTIVIFITLILCIVFIKTKTLNLKVTEEYEYIQNNKKNIEEVIIRNDAQLGTNCYKLDTNKAYEILNNIEIKKKQKCGVLVELCIWSLNLMTELKKVFTLIVKI